MTPALSVEPLFAHHAREWLRIWVVAQGVALTIGTIFALDRSAGNRAPPAWPRLLVFVSLVVLTHAMGFFLYRRLLARRWAVLLYLPICWAILLWGTIVHPAYSFLILVGVLQGFIFLPFAWAALILGVLTTSLAASIAWNARDESLFTAVSRVGAILGMGLMTGTVLLYIHRANREAALRTALMEQLEAAQRDLAERSREAGVLAERQRLAHDIHDTLAQGFASVIRHLETVELALPPSKLSVPDERWVPQVRTHLGHAQAVSRASLAEIRQLVLALRPTELTNAPLAAALDRVVHHWSDSHGIQATFTAESIPALRQDAEVVLLRALQESLSNVARHARATSVAISLACIDELVMLTVEDDGAGFVPGEASGAEVVGLSGMRERARRLGGYVMIDSTRGEGTSLTLAMPLAAIVAAGRDTELDA